MHAEGPALTLPPPPEGWPYWVAIPGTVKAVAPSFSLPLAEASIERRDGAEARWAAAPLALRNRVLEEGFAVLVPNAPTMSVGAFYEELAQQRVPRLITIDALFAVSSLAVNAALADAEAWMTPRAFGLLLHRLDARLTAAERGARPDLIDGIHAAEGVVAVALILADGTYLPPSEVKDAVIEEAVLVRSHPGVAMSRILHHPIDYGAFAAQGPITRETGATGTFLAAQWLSGATFTFGAEGTGPVDMSSARMRTRGALLASRLVMASSDADADARRALQELDRVDQLMFGDASLASPLSLADLAARNGFDLHDARIITDAAQLDRIRRASLGAFDGMGLLPLRQAPEARLFTEIATCGRPLAFQSGLDVARWLGARSASTLLPTADAGSPGTAREPGSSWSRTGLSPHASCYASGLDAIAAWLAPSASDTAEVFADRPSWQDRKLEAALAAWTLLRHDGIAHARTAARASAPADLDGTEVRSPDAIVLVEPHPEAIAAELSFVRQVDDGLTALRALTAGAPSRSVLTEVESILDVALTAAREESEGPSEFTARSSELRDLPRRLGAIEARTSPAAGPFAVVVHRDQRAAKVLLEGTTGLDALYAVLPDPRTGRALLTVGAVLAHAEMTLAARDTLTDQAWAERIASASPPVRDPFTDAIAELR